MDSSVYIIIAIIAVMVLRRISPKAGALLGVLVGIAVGVWGFGVYEKGATMNFAGFSLTKEIFLGLIILWVGMEGLSLKRALKVRS